MASASCQRDLQPSQQAWLESFSDATALTNSALTTGARKSYSSCWSEMMNNYYYDVEEPTEQSGEFLTIDRIYKSDWLLWDEMFQRMLKGFPIKKE